MEKKAVELSGREANNLLTTIITTESARDRDWMVEG